MNAPVLSLRSLQKRFGPKVAVDALSLDVPAGSMLGLLGPNGAGKTTTLSMATGLLRPDGGTASVLGVDVWSDPVAAKARKEKFLPEFSMAGKVRARARRCPSPSRSRTCCLGRPRNGRCPRPR